MAFLGTHVLLITHDFPEGDTQDFNEWYVREHMPERVIGLPGFNRGRRYRALDERPQYLAFYETTDARALSSDSYLKLVRNFDPRSRLFVPRFQAPSRTVSTVRASHGLGDGGVLGLIGFDARAGAVDGLRSAKGKEIIQDLVTRHGITGAHLLEADEEALSHSRQGHLRQNDLVLPWTLIVEAIDEAALDTVWQRQLAPAPLAEAGFSNILLRCRYRMLFSLTAPHSLKQAE
ncbi:MAG: hypothetical protein Q8M24_00370 [Pseudolabrys sp.]|nr:hypothetical protein [Pseudolabrys sp.]MDP2293901.1 hypothetical protein [Pseudolabrys sp.]